MRLCSVRRLLAGILVASGMSPAIAQDSSECGGMSLVFEGNCGAETRFVRICFGDGAETTFSVDTGESHSLWVDQGSTYNAICGQEAYGCPGEFTIAIESCSDEPPGVSEPPLTPPEAGKRRPKTEGG